MENNSTNCFGDDMGFLIAYSASHSSACDAFRTITFKNSSVQ